MTGIITKALVDTGIWSRRLRSPNPHLMTLLKSGRVVMHPFVIAELSLYSWPDRMTVLAMLEDMPKATVAGLEEVRDLIAIRSSTTKALAWWMPILFPRQYSLRYPRICGQQTQISPKLPRLSAFYRTSHSLASNKYRFWGDFTWLSQFLCDVQVHSDRPAAKGCTERQQTTDPALTGLRCKSSSILRRL